ncbi:MAG: GNAT family N-acetyltransferase [Gammaproteobacteria bacterium]
MMPNFNIRHARLDEVDILNRLIHLSALKLSENYYTSKEIEGLNQYVFGVDKELIIDKTYFVIELDNIIAGCGGYSLRNTLFGGDQSSSRVPGFLDPAKDPAKIRAFFIHPDFARQGLATILLQHCEQEARKAGFTTLELMATVPGISFYTRHGFIAKKDYTLTLPNRLPVKFLYMDKEVQNNANIK